MIVGVDPGNNGAIAAFDKSTAKLVCVFDMPTVSIQLTTKTKATATRKARYKKRTQVDVLATFEAIRELKPTSILIERVWGMPTDGVVSAFGFGFAFACARTTAVALGLNDNLVMPSEWKKYFGLIGKAKEESCVVASSIFSEFEFYAPPNRNGVCKPLDGHADAALIALYAHEKSIS